MNLKNLIRRVIIDANREAGKVSAAEAKLVFPRYVEAKLRPHCNCVGVMGAGDAVQVGITWEKMLSYVKAVMAIEGTNGREAVEFYYGAGL